MTAGHWRRQYWMKQRKKTSTRSVIIANHRVAAPQTRDWLFSRQALTQLLYTHLPRPRPREAELAAGCGRRRGNVRPRAPLKQVRATQPIPILATHEVLGCACPHVCHKQRGEQREAEAHGERLHERPGALSIVKIRRKRNVDEPKREQHRTNAPCKAGRSGDGRRALQQAMDGAHCGVQPLCAETAELPCCLTETTPRHSTHHATALRAPCPSQAQQACTNPQ